MAAQIFDKALTEPTFCALYSQLCHDLNRELPDFEPPQVPTEGKPPKCNFRYILLNKCQMEFEKGSIAKTAVEQREKATGLPVVCLPYQLID